MVAVQYSQAHRPLNSPPPKAVHKRGTPPHSQAKRPHYPPRIQVCATLPRVCIPLHGLTETTFMQQSPFTQLAADNQHAPLGLMLLAVLARTAAVICETLPEDPVSPVVSALAAKPTYGTSDDSPVYFGISPEADKGVAIPRGNRTSSNCVVSSEAKPSSNPKEGQSDQVQRGRTMITKKKKKKTKSPRESDDFSSLFGSLS